MEKSTTDIPSDSSDVETWNCPSKSVIGLVDWFQLSFDLTFLETPAG